MRNSVIHLLRRLRLAQLVLAVLPLAAGCAATRSEAPVWTGAPVAIASSDAGAYFAPSDGLQFLIDPYPEGIGPSWLGADVGTSIQVDDDRYIWIFGDSLMGSVQERCPDDEAYCNRVVDHGGEEVGMIRNSVGTSERAAGGSFRRIVKHWPTVDGEPQDMFPSGVDGQFLWPLAGVRAGDPVLITANRHTPQSGLAPVGNALVRIANPEDEPTDWRITRHELPNFRAFDGPAPSLVWTMAIVQVGHHVYIFGELGSSFDARTVLSRVDAAEVTAANWKPAPEYLQRNARGRLHWSPRFDVNLLHTVRGLPGTSETTVNHDRELGWYSYQLAPLGYEIHRYTAPDLEGPWRDSGIVYRLPSPWSTAKQKECAEGSFTCAEYIAYAVKAHPELAPEGGRVLTYNVNLASGSFRGAELAAQAVPGFYIPQMIVGPAGAPVSVD
ncbi:MAG: hypothetical protein P8R42_14820 [Candidatus Binatia bacterium]|nr:hypothetical protein [Candidatus Binatia bacterium]